MIKKILAMVGLVIYSTWVSCGFAAEGTGAQFSLVTQLNILTVTTTNPGKFYQFAGIKILTPGYRLKDNRLPPGGGYYLFPVSDTQPAEFNIVGPEGEVSVSLCLSAMGTTANCETHVISQPKLGYIFITSTTYDGNLGGASGGDALCQTVAYQAGSIIPAGYTFKALLVTDTRAPCSSLDGGVSGSCGAGYAKDWPLAIGQKYLNANSEFFNTVNEFGIFDGSNPQLFNEQGAAPADSFWSGIQSILSNTDSTDIVAWAYDDMNSAADGLVYATFLRSCNGFTSNNSSIFGNLGRSGTNPVGGAYSGLTWGNWADFTDTASSSIRNIFSAQRYVNCGANRPLACVAAD